MKVFAYVYCPYIHGSTEIVISLHFTKEGAQKVMEAAKQDLYEAWLKDQQWRRNNPQFGIKPEIEYKESGLSYHAVKEREILE